MNKQSVESAFSGLPNGTFTWNDEATLVFTPTQPYQSNTALNITLANSFQSATGFGIPEPIEISFIVTDYLHTTNVLPQANATDVNVQSAIVLPSINRLCPSARTLTRYRLRSRWYHLLRGTANGSTPARTSSIPTRHWLAEQNTLSAWMGI
jgi:hypothetical protein